MQPQPSAPSAPTASGPLTVGDLLNILWRRRLLVVPVALVACVVVFIALMRQTPLFEAEAALAIDRGRKAVRFEETPGSERIEFSLLNTQRDMLLSRQVLGAVIDQLGLDQELPFAEAADPVATLLGRVRVSTSRDSWVIKVFVRDESPERATRIAGSMLDRFIDAQNRQQVLRAEGALSFLSGQVTSARERLGAARQAEISFREERGISRASAESNVFTDSLAQLTTARLEVERQISQRQALINQGAENPLQLARINNDPLVIEARKRLLTLEERRVELAQRFLERHPRMLEISAQLEQASGEVQRAAEVAWNSLQSDLRSLQDQHQQIVASAAAVDEQLAAYRRDLSHLDALTQESRSRERLLEQLLTRLAEEEVSSRLEAGQVTVIDPPRAGVRPVNIRRSLFAAASMLVGMMAGVGIALLAELRDRRVRGAAGAVAETQLPVLSRLPQTPEVAPLGASGDPRHPAALSDAIRVLRSALGLAAAMPPRVLVITSASAGEGKSTIAARLAISAAAAGIPTLLVDADLRRPTQHIQFGLDGDSPGLAEALNGEAISPGTTSYGPLSVLGAGKSAAIDPEALSRPAFGELLASWRQTFQLVIIDTPPLGVVADALPVCEGADQVALVVRDRLVTKGALGNAMARLQPLRGRVAGMVINAEQLAKDDDYGYGYGYGAQD